MRSLSSPKALSHENISQITNQVLEQLQKWQNRTLKNFIRFCS
ncbi:MAG: transposase [Lachnospiraceae bacterium]